MRATPRAAWAILTLLVVVSAIGRFWLARGVPTPWISPDEMIYGLLGRTLYRSGRLAVLGAHSGFYSFVYPAFVGLPLAVGDPVRGYAVAKALQAFVMSLAAVPVYLWARTFVSTRSALAAAALTLAVPAFAYTGLLMTEALFYPLLALAAWAMALALERPTLGRQAAVVGLIALAVLTRLQAIVLVPVFVTALLLQALLERRRPAVRLLAPGLGGIAALVAGWAVWRVAAGGGALGAYSVVASSGYHAGAAARFVLYHLGDLVLLTGFFPVCAIALLWLERSARSAAERAYLAVVVSLSLWLVLEVGVFASRYVGRLAERDLVGAAPVLFIGLLLWLERGAPRTRRRAAVVALAALASVFALPLHTVFTRAALPDAFTLIPLYRLVGGSPLATQQLVLDGSLAVAACVLVLAPRRLLALVPLVLVGALGAGSVVAANYVADSARAAQTRFLGPDRHWIDRSADGPVALVYDGASEWNLVWESLFWNRRVDRVVTLPGVRVLGPVPGGEAELGDDGSLTLGGRAVRTAYVVAPESLQLDGTPVVDAGQIGGVPVGLRLWRVDRPVNVLAKVEGLQPNGDVYQRATVRGYGCRSARLRLTLIAKQPETIDLLRGGRLYQRLRLAPPTVWHGVVPAFPDRRGRCRFDVLTHGKLLGSTVVQLERTGG